MKTYSEHHPMTPPEELVQQWRESKILLKDALVVAAQWGADQELDACITWLDKYGLGRTGLDRLRNARRPQPPSWRA
jgi:hypothetical protein